LFLKILTADLPRETSFFQTSGWSGWHHTYSDDP